MAIYTAALSLGFALGPVILTVIGTDGLAPFLVGGGIALLALLSIAMPWVRTPSFERPAHPNLLRYLALAPVALGATLINAAVETAGMSFLPLYAMRVGWQEQSATLLLSVLLLGAILMQLPIGWLGDRMDRRRLVIGLGVLSAAGALLWPLVIDTPLLAYPLLFLWGGVFVGIYTVMMALVGSRFKGAISSPSTPSCRSPGAPAPFSARGRPARRWTGAAMACRFSQRWSAPPSRC